MPKINPEALRAMLTKDGYSIAGFAQAVEMTPGHLSNVLAGRRGASAAVIKRMATTLAVPMSALLWQQVERQS